MRTGKYALITAVIFIMTSTPLWSADFYHKGYDLMNSKQYCEAATTLEKAIIEYPDDFNLQYLIGLCHYKCGHKSKSIAPLEKSLTMTSKPEEISKAAFLLGHCYLELSKPDSRKALASFKKAISASSEDFNAIFYAGKVSMELNDFQEAIRYLKKAKSLKPKHSPTFLYLGLAYRKINSIDKSVEELESCLKLNPKDQLAPLYLSYNYLDLRDYMGAKKAGLVATENVKKNMLDSAYNNLGTAQLGLKEYPAAIKSFDKVISLRPNVPGAYYNKGQALEALKMYKEALDNYMKAYELNPKDCDYTYKVAHAYELIAQDCIAADWYRKCEHCESTGDACKAYRKRAQERCDRKKEEG